MAHGGLTVERSQRDLVLARSGLPVAVAVPITGVTVRRLRHRQQRPERAVKLFLGDVGALATGPEALDDDVLGH